MATVIVQNPGDVVIQLRGEDYRALMALLSEFEAAERLTKLCEAEQLELTPQQCARLSELWRKLAGTST